MKKEIVLTVAESKRLIAKGVASLSEVKRAMKSGIVVVATGTTNSYVLEELWNKSIDKRRYRSGITTPDNPEKSGLEQDEAIPDVVFKNGFVAKELDRFNAIKQMIKGDVYIKGANALDYLNKTVGVLIGSSTGGTVGAVIGNIIGKQLTLVIPIGLEKLVYEDINELHRTTMKQDYDGPKMWPLHGIIITEIEAIQVLYGVQSTLLAAGGVAGAEGSVRLLLQGSDTEVESAMTFLKRIKGEPKYVL